jgi:hypothetical protein
LPVSFRRRALAAAAVAHLTPCAPGPAAAAGTLAKTPRDESTILVKWSWPPPTLKPPGTTLGELKTKVRIVKVPRGFDVDELLALYRSLPGVVYAEPNFIASQNASLSPPNDNFFAQQWGLAKMHALDGWGVYPGTFAAAAGAPIAIVDTGVDALHPDLIGHVAMGATCVTGICMPAGSVPDPNGHGTVNAGAAAATANNTIGVAGLAYGAKVIPVKVLDATGNGTYAAIAAGIIWAADHGARVINLSLAGTAPSQSLCDAVSYAVGKGAFVDAATGNMSTGEPIYPAACPGAVGVGATDQNDAVPAWSDYGSPNVFVSAPGVSIHATYLNGGYALGTGTSISTALVSGLASLLLGQNPSRTPADVRRILAATSDKVGAAPYGADPYHTCTGCTWSEKAGYGRINVYRALSIADPPGPGSSSAASPPTAPPASEQQAPAPDFALSASPDSATAAQGGNATYSASIAGQNGFNGAVSLEVTGLPAGAGAAFAPTSVPTSGSSTLTVSAAAGTPAGSYTLTIRGTNGSLVHTATVKLVVTAAAPPPPPPPVSAAPAASDFSFLASPGSRILKQSKPTTFTLVTTGPGGPPAEVAFSISGLLPAGVTATFTPVAPGVTSLQLEAGPASVRFTNATLTIVATAGPVTHTATVTITIL